ncbi:pentapeptide repeat-containing protein [Streptomyces liangshanensis]|uniref:pentapeptide repeat-containing protein n=1 Tax=Streptomyces liangshanensis TaxID=2717324 RepID=UPI0036DC13C6
MKDSARDRPTIANVLATYIRTHAAKPPARGQDIPADVNAAFTVLVTRDAPGDADPALDLHAIRLPRAEPIPVTAASAAGDAFVNLSGANLSYADLTGARHFEADLSNADLAEANLFEARLKGADLSGADLSDVDLYGADLSRADLSFARLSGANLADANLTGASMIGVNLAGTDLTGTDLTGVDLISSDLRRAEGLTRKQVDSARTDGMTLLPSGLS